MSEIEGLFLVIFNELAICYVSCEGSVFEDNSVSEQNPFTTTGYYSQIPSLFFHKYSFVERNYMKTFIADIIPKIQRFSQKLDDLTKLTNQHWVSLGDIMHEKKVFIFRDNNQLLISVNGIVEKGTWDYIGNQSLLIETIKENYLMKQGFLDEDIFALKLDSSESYVFFVNETRYERELNKIQDILIYLERKYIPNQFNSKKTFRNYNNLGGGLFPNYSENSPIEQKQIFGNVFYTIYIHFENSFSDFYHYYPKQDKYSYQKNYKGEVFFDRKDDCLMDLYEDRLRHQ